MISLTKPLMILIALDCATTCIAVGSLGATELNPLMLWLGGLAPFMLCKIAMAIVVYCILTHYEKSFPSASTYGLIPLCVLYMAVFVSNIVNLINFLLG